MMADYLIVGILLLLVVFALLRARKHFRGGGCCGSGGNTIRPRKKLTAPCIGTIILDVEGMHCENCQARIERELDKLDGVVCKVNLHHKTATITYSSPISPDALKQAVEALGYQVAGIR